jgi:hypothetical protein
MNRRPCTFPANNHLRISLTSNKSRTVPSGPYFSGMSLICKSRRVHPVAAGQQQWCSQPAMTRGAVDTQRVRMSCPRLASRSVGGRGRGRRRLATPPPGDHCARRDTGRSKRYYTHTHTHIFFLVPQADFYLTCRASQWPVNWNTTPPPHERGINVRYWKKWRCLYTFLMPRYEWIYFKTLCSKYNMDTVTCIDFIFEMRFQITFRRYHGKGVYV